jgi:hypothetical protein
MRLFSSITLIVAFVLVPDFCFAEQSARGIMQKMKDRDDGDNRTADMEMVLIDADGDRRLRKIKVFVKDRNKDVHKLLYFTHPANLKETSFLTLDYYSDGRDDDQWLYLPALHKAKQIASTNKSGSFMGSDLNYVDMATVNLSDYTFSFYKRKEMDVGGAKTWVIEAAPKNKAVIDKTGYRKSLFLINQETYMMVRAIRWEKDEEHVKYIEVSDIDCIDGIWVGRKIMVKRKRNKQTVHTTLLTLKNIKFNQALTLDLFSRHRLGMGL